MWLKPKVYEYIRNFIEENLPFIEPDQKEIRDSDGVLEALEACYTLKDPQGKTLETTIHALWDQIHSLQGEIDRLNKFIEYPADLQIYEFGIRGTVHKQIVIYFNKKEYVITKTILKLIHSEVYPKAGTAELYDIYLLFKEDKNKRHYIFCPKLETVKFVGYVKDGEVNGTE